jgi:hypothetical protein
MNTAVQLRVPSAQGQGLRCELVHGAPRAFEAGRLGPVALFGPGAIVAYGLVTTRGCPRLFVFRTLVVDDRLAATVPGVRPRVRLLLALYTAGRIRRARRLFAYLLRTNRDPSALSDAFYFRVSAALGGRLPVPKIVHSVLSLPVAPSDAWTS